MQQSTREILRCGFPARLRIGIGLIYGFALGLALSGLAYRGWWLVLVPVGAAIMILDFALIRYALIRSRGWHGRKWEQ